MNLLSEKLKLYGPSYRCGGDGGDGGGDGDGGSSGGPSGSSGASAEGSGSSSGPGGGPAGSGSSGASSSSDSSSGGASSSGSSSSGEDTSGVMSGPPDPTDTDGTESVGSTTVSANAEPNEATDPGSGNHAGIFSNSVLNGLFNQTGSAITGLPVGLMNNTIAALMGNQSVANQAAIINSIIGLAPVIGPINGLANAIGLGSIGSAIAGMGGVPADSVASDPSAAGGDIPGSLGGMFGAGGTGQGSSNGFNTAAMLGMSGGDPLLASLFKEQGKSPIATNKFLKDIMKSENQYG